MQTLLHSQARPSEGKYKQTPTFFLRGVQSVLVNPGVLGRWRPQGLTLELNLVQLGSPQVGGFDDPAGRLLDLNIQSELLSGAEEDGGNSRQA